MKGVSCNPRTLGILAAIICGVIALLILLITEGLGYAKALPHHVLVVLMIRAWSIEELLLLCVIVVLSARLLDGGDDVVWSVATKLLGF